MSKTKVMVMFSGGMDSTVMIADLIGKGHDVYPLSFYDRSEPDSLRVIQDTIVRHYGLSKNHIWADMVNTRVLEGSDLHGYIPGYKMLMLTTALAYCEVYGIKDLYMGYTLENGTYTDETPESIQAVIRAYQANYPKSESITVHNPYIHMSRAEVARFGFDLEAPLDLTTSCHHIHMPPPQHCGACKRCAYRWDAFRLAGVYDFTIYHNGITGWQHGTNIDPKRRMVEQDKWQDGYAETGVRFDDPK